MPEQPPPPPVQVTTIEHRVDFGVDPMTDYSRPEHAPAESASDADATPRGAGQL